MLFGATLEIAFLSSENVSSSDPFSKEMSVMAKKKKKAAKKKAAPKAKPRKRKARKRPARTIFPAPPILL